MCSLVILKVILNKHKQCTGLEIYLYVIYKKEQVRVVHKSILPGGTSSYLVIILSSSIFTGKLASKTKYH